MATTSKSCPRLPPDTASWLSSRKVIWVWVGGVCKVTEFPEFDMTYDFSNSVCATFCAWYINIITIDNVCTGHPGAWWQCQEAVLKLLWIKVSVKHMLNMWWNWAGMSNQKANVILRLHNWLKAKRDLYFQVPADFRLKVPRSECWTWYKH